MSPPTEPRAFTLQEPERFLNWLATHETEASLGEVRLMEMWSLAAMAALAREGRQARLAVKTDRSSAADQFARAVGFHEVIAGAQGPIQGQPGHTVRLNRVWQEEQVEPVARAIAQLLAGETQHRSARWAVQYVTTELLRNVVQHSEDELGGVVGAQKNERGLHEKQPTYQVVVADNGIGIKASLRRNHQDVDDDAVAIDHAMWPHFSGRFPLGRTGGEENAGLGLFFISELAKELNGRLLISSGSSTIFIDPSQPDRQQAFAVGYPGTLVAFEFPAEIPGDFDDIFKAIAERAEQRTPKRLVKEWLRYEAPPAECKTFAISAFLENNHQAQQFSQRQLLPRLLKKEPVALDFVNVPLVTQSFAHALLYEALRFAWASQTPIYIVNTRPVVRSALDHVQRYAQGG